MQYESFNAASNTCGHGNYYIVDANTIKTHECELYDGKYLCLTGLLSLMDPLKVPAEGRIGYSHKDNRKLIFI